MKKSLLALMYYLLWLLGLLLVLDILSMLAISSLSRQAIDLANAWRFHPLLSSRIYSADGQLMAEFGREYRTLVSYERIPPRLIQAFLAAEDISFFEHGAVDWGGVITAIVRKKYDPHSKLGGHSTITQQLARGLPGNTLQSSTKLLRPLREMLLANGLEQEFNKEEILWRYLNLIYFGHNMYGIQAASRGYFRKDVSELNLAEMATLAGIPRRPSDYSPINQCNRSQARRASVLKSMLAAGFISQQELDLAASYNLVVPPLNAHLQKLAPYFIAWVELEMSKRINKKVFWQGGLAVHTTLDVRSQRTARKLLQRGTTGPGRDIQGALLSINAHNGHVLAMVGGRDYAQSSFNWANMACRDPGSILKPIIISAAATDIEDLPKHILKKNYKPTCQQLSDETLTSHSRRLGLNNIYLSSRPRHIFGSYCVTLWELVGAYNVFNRRGEKVKLTTIVSVKDRKGRILFRHMPVASAILDRENATAVNRMLRLPETHSGQPPRQARYGKQGHTSTGCDGWFIGYTRDLVTGVWVGRDSCRGLEAKRPQYATAAHEKRPI